ncbi:phosphatidylinositol 3-kinase [Striga asiatica]|uniref:Phosphatidylinositol 3-kinase n=1 Tax=Striga asiatica TaxID=4170 RepID=A0A5A7R9K6_STRAF|nr:phosphatidylinositol 3-kinase [Striga asiatica]
MREMVGGEGFPTEDLSEMLIIACRIWRLDLVAPSYSWNELVTLRTKYCDLIANSQLSLTFLPYCLVFNRSIQIILRYPPTMALTGEEKQLLWKFRSEKRALPKFLRCVKWSDDVQEVKQALELMGKWVTIDVCDALELLSPYRENHIPAVFSFFHVFSRSRLSKNRENPLPSSSLNLAIRRGDQLLHLRRFQQQRREPVPSRSNPSSAATLRREATASRAIPDPGHLLATSSLLSEPVISDRCDEQLRQTFQLFSIPASPPPSQQPSFAADSHPVATSGDFSCSSSNAPRPSPHAATSDPLPRRVFLSTASSRSLVHSRALRPSFYPFTSRNPCKRAPVQISNFTEPPFRAAAGSPNVSGTPSALVRSSRPFTAAARFLFPSSSGLSGACEDNNGQPFVVRVSSGKPSSPPLCAVNPRSTRHRDLLLRGTSLSALDLQRAPSGANGRVVHSAR